MAGQKTKTAVPEPSFKRDQHRQFGKPKMAGQNHKARDRPLKMSQHKQSHKAGTKVPMTHESRAVKECMTLDEFVDLMETIRKYGFHRRRVSSGMKRVRSLFHTKYRGILIDEIFWRTEVGYPELLDRLKLIKDLGRSGCKKWWVSDLLTAFEGDDDIPREQVNMGSKRFAVLDPEVEA